MWSGLLQAGFYVVGAAPGRLPGGKTDLSCSRADATSWGGSSSQPTSSTKSACAFCCCWGACGGGGGSGAGGTSPSGCPSSFLRSNHSPAARRETPDSSEVHDN